LGKNAFGKMFSQKLGFNNFRKNSSANNAQHHLRLGYDTFCLIFGGVAVLWDRRLGRSGGYGGLVWLAQGERSYYLDWLIWEVS